jgi:hypothetical protein
MRATLQTGNDGTVALQLDSEAARAVFASVLFASRLNEAFAPLVEVAREGLDRSFDPPLGENLCR